MLKSISVQLHYMNILPNESMYILNKKIMLYCETLYIKHNIKSTIIHKNKHIVSRIRQALAMIFMNKDIS
jgi:hypothetical protein